MLQKKKVIIKGTLSGLKMKEVSVKNTVHETMKRDRIDHEENSDVHKKSKSNNEEDEDCDGEIWDAVSNAWDHYRNYLNSSEDGESGDIDELLELIEILGPFVPLPTNNRSDDNKIPEALTLNDIIKSYCSIESLLPVLMSLSYSHLGSHAVAESLIKMNQCSDDNDTKNEQKKHLNNHSSDAISGLLDDPPEKYLEKSLMYFSGNASSLSIYANYKRMNILDSQENICKMYEVTSENANCIRAGALHLLEKDEAEIDNACKEWIELLFLNGVCCSEYIVDDEESNKDGNDTPTVEQEDNEISNGEEDMEEEEGDGYFSMSQVEATSSFMAALLNSTLGNHDVALKYLRKFKVTHRIHPNVWNRCLTFDTNKQMMNNDDNFLFEPLSFRSSTGTKDSGILPPRLYNRMCEVFAPTASYWRESDYNNRGYYSYFHNLSEDNIPKNLIEDVVMNHLIPRIKHLVKDEKIVGFEWWTHTRPVAANLGHQLHFDTDETLLAQDDQITHPIISSVLYLSSSAHSIDAAGSTVVFHQHPHSKVVGDKAWISATIDNSFMVFPGNALHGVLPCRGTTEHHQKEQEKQHRLTFMVGFWTRKVPDRMKNRHLYGPCGPLPPSSKDNSWVKEIEKGYMKEDYFQETMQNKIKTINLPVATPCWEVIPYNEDKNDNQDELALELPKGLDHRFFVHDAPTCFKQSLFQKENMF